MQGLKRPLTQGLRFLIAGNRQQLLPRARIVSKPAKNELTSTFQRPTAKINVYLLHVRERGASRGSGGVKDSHIVRGTTTGSKRKVRSRWAGSIASTECSALSEGTDHRFHCLDSFNNDTIELDIGSYGRLQAQARACKQLREIYSEFSSSPKTGHNIAMLITEFTD